MDLNVICELTERLHQRDEKINKLEKTLRERDATIQHLRLELDKYGQIMDLSMTSTYLGSTGPRLKRMAISAEPLGLDSQPISKYDKSERSRQLIRTAILKNNFMKHLELSQIHEIVDCMYPLLVPIGSTIMREGDVGSTVFIIEEGEVEVSKNGEHLGVLATGDVLGELGILYNFRRTATFTALSDCQLWAIDRQTFQKIMMKTGLLKQSQYIEFLKSVPIFKELPDETLIKMCDGLQESFYKKGDYIVRQGARGETFFIISRGKVCVTMKQPDTIQEKYIRTLNKGDFFGEKALQGDDLRTASIVADDTEGVECLVIDRETFNQLISPIEEIKHRYDDDDAEIERRGRSEEFRDVQLQDLESLAILGHGGFGKVELVQISYDPTRSFALKTMHKEHIIKTGQDQHIKSEIQIMSDANCDFIVKLYKTFYNNDYIYMLMEVCLGGELWKLLQDRIYFQDSTVKFYIACVIEAFDYLHSRNIIYRDLKPENLVLDCQGYLKLVDFGFAKRLQSGKKTWTVCGTPEYIAPEVILNKGHDMSADYWSLGILMFELLAGKPPFTDSSTDPMMTYNKILQTKITAVNFPKIITRNATDMITKLCRYNSVERLGYQRGGISEIQKHKWFDGFNWEGLRSKTLQAPILPKVKSISDTSNFEFIPDDLSAYSSNTWSDF